jgi:hypothetical protein
LTKLLAAGILAAGALAHAKTVALRQGGYFVEQLLGLRGRGPGRQETGW